MRPLFGCLAVFLCALSIALAARYGAKGADTFLDGLINAVLFGAIALCACVFDGAAVRLWFKGHRAGAIVIGVIAALALVVTFTNSLGAIAGRADTIQAERTRTKDAANDDRAALQRLTKARADLPTFTPASADDVAVAREAVAVAGRVRGLECDKRGARCRERETEEQTKLATLAAVLANKALTEKAAKLDSDEADVRKRLATTAPVQNPNPLGSVLEQLVGGAAAFLTAWQQAVVAGVFELCILGTMVIFELLGQGQGPAVATVQPGVASRPFGERLRERLRGWQGVFGGPRKGQIDPAAEPAKEPAVLPPGVAVLDIAGRDAAPGSRRRLGRIAAPRVVTPPVPAATVREFFLDRVAPADDGEHVEMKALLKDYREWCERKGAEPKNLGAFVDEVEAVCKKLRITIEALADKRVVCHSIKLVA